MKNLAEFDQRMRISSLSGEEQKQAQLLANFEKQKAEVEAMHEAQLLYAEDDMALKEEQYGRLLEMDVASLRPITRNLKLRRCIWVIFANKRNNSANATGSVFWRHQIHNR